MGSAQEPVITAKKQKSIVAYTPQSASLQSYPNSKTIFHRVKPVIVDESQDFQGQTQDLNKTQMTLSINLEEYRLMEQDSQAAEIKVRWNQFIKMKNRNYLEDYQIIREIGRGSFGTVNKVKSKYTNLFRAAKKIKKSHLARNEHEKLFMQMKILQSLDHSNIAKLFEVYNYKNHYVLILQLCQGGQLFKKIIISHGLSQNYIACIIKQILKTLLYLKHKGIVHRDIKPENMLFQKNSKILKIIDFGIATNMEPNQFLRQRLGTPYYIAPEVLLKQYDERCDVWSTGVIMYMMMCRRPPFRGDDEREVMENILKGSPVITSEMSKKYSPQCIDFLKNLLIKNPLNRLDVEKAYEHSWIQSQNASLGSSQGQNDVLDNLGNFKFKNKLQAVVYTFIVSQILTNDEKDTFIQIFEQLDRNHDGVISKLQFKSALQTKSNISVSRMNLMMRVIDTNNSGYIDLTEFIVAGLKMKDIFTKDHFEQAFAYFDIDHSGEISYDEIAFFLEDKRSSQESIKKIFRQIDKNNDGMISRQEFVQLLMKSNRLKYLSKKQQGK